MAYNRRAAVAYAHKWAYGRNPEFYDFTNLGGDCTNFVSQCLYAGSGVMNFAQNNGWYYISPASRSPSWTGVRFLYEFLISNKGAGPYGRVVPIREAEPGDVIQLNMNGSRFAHSVLIVRVGSRPRAGNIFVAAHSYDTDFRVLSSYDYRQLRLIKIDGARAANGDEDSTVGIFPPIHTKGV